jgi:PKD repeat protein
LPSAPRAVAQLSRDWVDLMIARPVARRVSLAAALATAVTVLHAQNAAVTVTVDVTANRRPIDPAIYGVAYATTAQLQDLNAPLHRYGGNNTSRYNWELNADNRGADWYFQSIPEASATPGQRGDTFVADSRAANAAPMLTIPMIEYVARLGASRSKLASFNSDIYGAQDDCDWQWFPKACNGMKGGQPVVGNNPLDANVLNSTTLQAGWVSHLVQRFGTATNGGVRHYILDNEPSIWHSTHRDVWPVGATMEQVRDLMTAYSGAIKNVDPGALVAGPEEWGWSGYIFSGYDQQYGARHGWSYLPDRAAHDGMDYLPWLLRELKQRSDIDQRRVLDLFTVHYYPQGGEFWPQNDVSTAMQQRRNRSTRSLWDPAYTDETWINDEVQLIPRLRNWVNTYYYPGTPIGITEYNWGAENHINGATAQADIYGIFGREGLDLAARWTTPAETTPTFKAMKMYRNYDGNRSTFGDTSVRATSSSNPDNVSVFAAERTSDGALTVMVIAKVLSGSTPVTVNLANFPPGAVAQAWQLTAANSIVRLADVALSGQAFAATVPAQSITLFVVPRAGGPANQAPVANAVATPASGTAPLSVTFDGTASSDPDGTIATYAWTFGDGGTASGATASHTYQTAGSYTAQLTVADNQGATASSTLTIVVSPGATAPSAPSNLRAAIGSGRVVTLTWTDTSSNETGFHVERAAKTKNPAFSRIASVGANVGTYTRTETAGTWIYRVQAFNGVGTSGYSNSATIRVR